MKRLILLSVTLVLLVGAHLALSQQDFSNVEFKVTHVAGSIHMLDSGVAGNIGVSAGPDGVLMIDDQFAPLAGKIRASVDKIGKGKLAFVINTHWHGDHTGGNAEFGKEAPILAHTNVRKRLAEQQSGPALPVITFDDSLSVHFNGEEVEVIHFPAGHTDGDSVIFFKGSNVVHMGDQFFNGRFPFIDLDSGGTVDGYMNNVAKVIKQLPAGVKIIPGHGPLASLEDLKAFHGMMTETTSHIRSLKKSGKTLAEAQAAGLPDKYKSWAWRFISTERWVEIVYNSEGS